MDMIKSNSDQYSPFCDFVYYNSSRDNGLTLGMRVLKPEHQSYILVSMHGWHQNAPDFVFMDKPHIKDGYLTLEVDMRGRAHSTGKPDCNGWELFDVIDAVDYAKQHYKDHILDDNIIFLEGESGGGGNVLSLVGKFPDYFAAASAFCGIADYKQWYENDAAGEFRDEMDIWVGCTPGDNSASYDSRSGISLIENLMTPMFIAHGETDIRVPSVHSRRYASLAKEQGKQDLVQYCELPGVGTTDHWGNASSTQLEKISKLSEDNRRNNKYGKALKRAGELVIGGYVFTKHFSVVLDSVDKMARLEYDLDRNFFKLSSFAKCDFELNLYDD